MLFRLKIEILAMDSKSSNVNTLFLRADCFGHLIQEDLSHVNRNITFATGA